MLNQDSRIDNSLNSVACLLESEPQANPPELRRELPPLASFEEAVSICDREKDTFFLEAFRLQNWLGKLIAQAVEDYADSGGQHQPMQFGQAQRGFLQVFGHVGDREFADLLHHAYRFIEFDHPLSGILFQAVVPLSLEHESDGDFAGRRALDHSKRPRESVSLLRQSVERWCDWVDAVVHLQTHAVWHLAPGCFAARNHGDWTSLGIHHWFLARMSDPGKAQWPGPHAAAVRRFKDSAQWQAQPADLQNQRTWPHPELDEAVISLWPLLKRHNWTFGDLLNVLRDLLPDSNVYPCENERNLATYCARSLRLRKFGHGKTSHDSRPPGYELSLRLCLRRVSSIPRPTSFGTPEATSDPEQKAPPITTTEQLAWDFGRD